MKYFFSPDTLRDPVLGPMVQKHLENGTGELTEKLCEPCAKLRDALEYCERRAALELEPTVAVVPGNDMHYHTVLRMIRDAAQEGLKP